MKVTKVEIQNVMCGQIAVQGQITHQKHGVKKQDEFSIVRVGKMKLSKKRRLLMMQSIISQPLMLFSIKRSAIMFLDINSQSELCLPTRFFSTFLWPPL